MQVVNSGQVGRGGSIEGKYKVRGWVYTGRCSVQCPVFLTNLEGKVGKVGRVGKVGKVGKEGRLRE
jgi:hypothetical protein